MHRVLLVLCAFLLASFGLVVAKNVAQDQTKDSPSGSAEHKITQEDIDRKNPVKATPESLAAGRKVYGFDCAMCHGDQGDGKGDLVESMKLTMHDWRESRALAGMTDGEIRFIIINGKGKMPGEENRLPDNMCWNLVNVVRDLSKKGTPEKPSLDTTKP